MGVNNINRGNVNVFQQALRGTESLSNLQQFDTETGGPSSTDGKISFNELSDFANFLNTQGQGYGNQYVSGAAEYKQVTAGQDPEQLKQSVNYLLTHYQQIESAKTGKTDGVLSSKDINLSIQA